MAKPPRDSVDVDMRPFGRYEHEILGVGPVAAESARAWGKCQKNPKHDNFIPASDFSPHHLPEELQHETYFQFIRLAMALTVRLRVNYTSSARPQGNGYFGSESTGPRIGTGFIYMVFDREKVYHNGELVPNPALDRKSWTIHIMTALHVVYDNQEAKMTTADLFHDDEESLSSGRKKSLPGVRVVGTFDEADWCELECVTEDEDLVNELSDLLRRMDQVHRNMEDRRRGDCEDKPKNVVIVSHPHGRFKYVTVGELAGWQEVTRGTAQYSYTADTCPGSSGAPVWILSRDQGGPSWPFDIVHHCVAGEEAQRNIGYRWFL